MLHAGLDLSRRRLDVCLIDDAGEVVEHTAAPPDADGLRHLAGRLRGQPVRAVIESMTGARFVHDTLEELGWEVLVADAQKVKGLAPLACKTDKIDARVLGRVVLARSGAGDLAARPVDSPRARAGPLSAASGPASHDAEEPHPRDADDLRASVPGLGSVRPRRPRAARPPGDPRPVAAQRRRQPGADRRPRSPDRLAHRRASPPGRRSPLHPAAGHRPRVRLDQRLHRRLRDRRHRALRLPDQALRLHRLCPRVYQSGASDRRGPISKQGSRYLRWALFEAALHACSHPVYAERYQRTKQRLGRQRGPKVAQIDLSRKLTEAIWHMLTRNEPFAPAGARFRLAA